MVTKSKGSTAGEEATTSGTDEDTIFIEGGDNPDNNGASVEDKAPVGDVISYIGVATRRIISKDTWEQIGVKNQDTVEWNRKNNFTIPASALKKAAKDYLETDNGFINLHNS